MHFFFSEEQPVLGIIQQLLNTKFKSNCIICSFLAREQMFRKKTIFFYTYQILNDFAHEIFLIFTNSL